MSCLRHGGLLLLWLLSTPVYAFEHVVLISVDGLRPDAISAQTTPNIHRLLKRAIYTMQAKAVKPSFTMPNHTSMLTGLDSKEHGVNWNHQRPDSYSGKTVFTILEDEGKSTSAFVAKPKLEFLLREVDTVHIEPSPEIEQLLTGNSARNIARLFIKTWNSAPAAFTLIHLREPDSVGHEYEWMSDEYFAAVSHADTAIGKIVEEIELSTNTNNTAMIITADHGGSGNNHGEDLTENRIIPWIVILPELQQSIVIHSSIKTYDTMPTILSLLEIKINGTLRGVVPQEVLAKIK